MLTSLGVTIRCFHFPKKVAKIDKGGSKNPLDSLTYLRQKIAAHF